MTLDSYKPGVNKLLHNLDHLQKIVNKQPTAPLHMAIFPNSKCQLNCNYCLGRDIIGDTGELSIENFALLCDILWKYGTKALEVSGLIGEPTLWSWFDTGIYYAKSKGFKLSLITNGLLLDKLDKFTLSKFDWIRVSIQNATHAKLIKFKEIPTKISGSYIYNSKSKKEHLVELKKIAEDLEIVIRVAVEQPDIEHRAWYVSDWIDEIGEPLFFSYKKEGIPKGCYMPYLRGAIDWNGYFLPCPSTQLTNELDNKKLTDFRICHISELEQWILNNPPQDVGYRCSMCNCGLENNNFVYDLLQDVENAEFI